MLSDIDEAIVVLSQWATDLEWDTVPHEIQDRCLLVLFDSLGVMLAGAATPEVRSFADAWIDEAGGAPVVGLDRLASPLASCWINGASLCCLELDEGNKYTGGHPAAHVLPAILATERIHEGTAWLTAFLAGYEVAAHLGRAIRLDATVHPHGTWGAAGAATAVGRLRHLDQSQISAAIDAACALSFAPPWQAAFEGNMVRNLWVGGAAAAGVVATNAALGGLAFLAGSLESGLGSILGTVSVEAIRPDGQFEIARGYIKRHASCAGAHPAGDALLDLISKEGPIDPSSVREIVVETYGSAAKLTSLQWPTRLAAMFSIPYLVSAILLRGRMDASATDSEVRRSPAMAELAARVRVVETAEYALRAPSRRGARVRVERFDGSLVESEIDDPFGDEIRPFGWNETRGKVADLVGVDTGEALERLVRALPDGDTRALREFLAQSPASPPS